MAAVVSLLLQGNITGYSAKHVLAILFKKQGRSVDEILKSEKLLLEPLSHDFYLELAKSVIQEHESVAAATKAKGGDGKAMFLVGQMIRKGERGRIEPKRAKAVLEEVLRIQCH